MDFPKPLKNTLLCHTRAHNPNSDSIMLMEIDKKTEDYIEDNECYKFHFNGKNITIKKEDIILYGEIDLSKEDDREVIKRKHLIDDSLSQSWIPSNFNYNHPHDSRHGAPTNDALKWFEYCHYKIGKPKRVIIFKINPVML